MDQPLRIGVIGAWGHGSHVLAEARAMGDAVRIVGCAKALPEDDPRAWATCHPAVATAPLYEEPAAMLRELRPQVVIISTRLDRIAPLAIEAAAAGCHTVCEKPLAICHEALGQLSKALAAADVQCVAMLNNAAHPVLAAAHAAVAAGRLGRIILCNARKSYRWGTRPDWFGDRRRYGGTIPWIGIHALDFIHAVTGDRFSAVAAMQGNAAHPDRPDCEDHCALLLKLRGGALATASVDYLRPAAAPSHGDDWLRIVGERGIIEAHMAGNRCSLMAEGEPPHDLPLPQPVAWYAQVLGHLASSPASVAGHTARSLMLTEAALHARDAADRRHFIEIA